MSKKYNGPCIGYGEYEGNCPNNPGTPLGPYWCERCNKLRIKYIDEQFKKMINKGEVQHIKERMQNVRDNIRER
jgi:hypothetical protein